jgi:hypothetical protein
MMRNLDIIGGNELSQVKPGKQSRDQVHREREAREE